MKRDDKQWLALAQEANVNSVCLFTDKSVKNQVTLNSNVLILKSLWAHIIHNYALRIFFHIYTYYLVENNDLFVGFPMQLFINIIFAQAHTCFIIQVQYTQPSLRLEWSDRPRRNQSARLLFLYKIIICIIRCGGSDKNWHKTLDWTVSRAFSSFIIGSMDLQDDVSVYWSHL